MKRRTDQRAGPGPLGGYLLKRLIRELYREIGTSAPTLTRPSYADLLRATGSLAHRSSPEELTRRTLRVVERLLPRPLRVATRSAIHNDRASGKISVLLVPPLLYRLVGPTHRRMASSTAVIHRCRFLVESGSAVQCIRMCKLPSERFFTRRLNIPMHLDPDLDSGRCVLTFGIAARSKVIERIPNGIEHNR